MTDASKSDDYYPGQTLSWYHGHAYLKVVTVTKVEPDRVRVRGMSCEYWIRRRTLNRNLGKPEPASRGTSINSSYSG